MVVLAFQQIPDRGHAVTFCRETIAECAQQATVLEALLFSAALRTTHATRTRAPRICRRGLYDWAPQG